MLSLRRNSLGRDSLGFLREGWLPMILPARGTVVAGYLWKTFTYVCSWGSKKLPQFELASRNKAVVDDLWDKYALLQSCSGQCRPPQDAWLFILMTWVSAALLVSELMGCGRPLDRRTGKVTAACVFLFKTNTESGEGYRNVLLLCYYVFGGMLSLHGHRWLLVLLHWALPHLAFIAIVKTSNFPTKRRETKC